MYEILVGKRDCRVPSLVIIVFSLVNAVPLVNAIPLV